MRTLGNAQPANPFLFRDQQFVTGANVSWNRGKHAFRGGVEWNHTQINHFQPQGGTFQQPRGSFEFNGYVTDLQGTTPTWFHSWADFMLGLPSGTGKARALFNPNALRWTTWAWYLQDHYQVTPKVMLTLGLRWEYYPFGYSDNNKGLRYLNLATGQVLIGGYGNVPKNDGIDTGIGQFLPRVGVAYNITPQTVIRAGYGMSSDPYTWHVLRNAYPAVLLDTNVPANTSLLHSCGEPDGTERKRARQWKLLGPDRVDLVAAAQSEQRVGSLADERQHDDDSESVRPWFLQLLQLRWWNSRWASP